MNDLMNLPWLTIIVMTPLIAAGLMLFVSGSSKGPIRVLAVAASTVSLVGSLKIG